jgi:hypothetical protein
MEALATMEAAHRAPGYEPATEALEFVRFCYRRRRVGWPELYDEMCAVAGRGLYLGWGPEELAAVGIRLSLFEMPALAALAARVIAEEIGTTARERGPKRADAAGRPAASSGASLTATTPEAKAGPSSGSMRLAPGAI